MTPEELYESHEYLIKKTLYKTYKFPRELCRKNQIEYEDLLQYARTGLWKAAITYDSTKGKFITYAINNIKWHVTERLQRECPVMKLNSDIKYDEEYMYGIVSMDEELELKDSAVSLHEVIPSDVNIEQTVIDNNVAKKALSRLNKRELNVLSMKSEGMANQKIGDFYGMTRENVRLILLSAKRKIDLYMNECEVV